jgi:hypothetical protein
MESKCWGCSSEGSPRSRGSPGSPGSETVPLTNGALRGHRPDIWAPSERVKIAKLSQFIEDWPLTEYSMRTSNPRRSGSSRSSRPLRAAGSERTAPAMTGLQIGEKFSHPTSLGGRGTAGGTPGVLRRGAGRPQSLRDAECPFCPPITDIWSAAVMGIGGAGDTNI